MCCSVHLDVEREWNVKLELDDELLGSWGGEFWLWLLQRSAPCSVQHFGHLLSVKLK